MGERSHTFAVGGLRIRFLGRGREAVTEPYASFLGGRGPLSATFRVEDAAGLPTSGRLLADGGIWQLREQARGQRIEFFAPTLHGQRPVLQADLSSDWSSGVIRVDPEICPPAACAVPFATPFGELLLVGLLSRAQGLYVHAASTLGPHGADLFLGRSGAGKTTLSGVAQLCGAQVLSDDRTVLRFQRGNLWAYGTPFHGTGRHWAAGAAPTRGLFFLEKALDSRFETLAPLRAAAQLAAVAFAPFWDRQALENTLRLVEAAVRLTPPFTLHFRPDASAWSVLDAATHSTS